MKKNIFLCFVLAIFASNLCAQEVHGIEITRKIINEESNGRIGDLRFGYKITNMNSIPVSVEIELYHKECEDDIYDHKLYKEELVETKIMTLKANESYMWEPTNALYGYRTPDGEIFYSSSRCRCYQNAINCYVKYKAYKIL